jgi:3-(3-hydroxy-phenyl)propionate hydroxylase
VNSALNTPDADDAVAWAGDMVPGAPLDDAPVRLSGQDAWLLDQLGHRFVLLAFADRADALDGAQAALHGQSAVLAAQAIPVQMVWITAHDGAAPVGMTTLHDRDGLIAQRLDARPGSAYLIRPDQHVAARWRAVDTDRLQAALQRATGHELPAVPVAAVHRPLTEAVTDAIAA